MRQGGGALPAATLAALASAHAALMADTCIVQTGATAADSVGQTRKTWTDGEEVPCGFLPRAAATVQGGAGDRLDAQFDGTFRLRLEDGQGITPAQRIKLTGRQGTALTTAEVFEVLGWPKVGVGAVLVEVRRVTGA